MLKACPFCGHEADSSDPDTLYPNGTGWKVNSDGLLSFHSFREVPKAQWCYSLHCVVTSGGCGAEMYGLTKQEAINKWNKRV